MNSDNWHRAKEIFNSALDRDPTGRKEYLEAACDGDADLRQRVEGLLGSYQSEFMEKPVFADNTTNHPTLRKGTIVGRYEIEKRIGSGGMGEVYLAADPHLGRYVAIKVLNPEYANNESNIRRFIQEAKAASALNHPNILTIHEIGQTDQSHYIVSEYIEGQTLRGALGVEDLSLRKVLDITIQIAEALSAAHSARIIHRDIKPENIVLRADGYVKVLDFGLAKLMPSPAGFEDETLEQNQTSKGLILGTVRYMAPEQARAATVDQRTDIFSLGVLLYEMVTGRTPFAGDSTLDVLANLLSKEPEPLCLLAPGVPDELQRIVSKTLRKDPDERYQTMKGLLADLRELTNQSTLDTCLDDRRVPGSEGIRSRTTGDPKHTTAESSTAIKPVWYRWPVLIGMTLILVLGAIIGGRYLPSMQLPQPEIRSLAILPLRSIGASDDSLGLGLADSIIRRLSSTGAVIVRPTSAVRKYANEETDAVAAANQLKADAVLEGTLQRDGERLRVSVNLLRAADGASLWTDSFDLRVADIFGLQDTISQKIASNLKLRLDPSQQARLGKKFTSSPEAYEYFVKGNSQFEQATVSIGDMKAMLSAVDYYKKATDADPGYALAFANLGTVYMWIANFNDPTNPIWVEHAKAAWSKAESMDPELAEIHEGWFEYYYSKYGGWDMSRAIRETRLAMQLNPGRGHSSIGTLYDHLGLDQTSGLTAVKRALEIDPTNVFLQDRLAESYRLYGKCEEANDTAIRFSGRPFTEALVCLGRLDEAQPLLDERIRNDPGNVRAKSALALLWAKKGNQRDAEAAIPEIVKVAQENRGYHHVTYNFAAVYALAGDAPNAVKWLRVTAETGMPNYPVFMSDPDFDRIRDTAEFKNFIPGVKETWERYKTEIENY